MTQRTGLFIAAALTAFVLVVGGAAAGNIYRMKDLFIKSGATSVEEAPVVVSAAKPEAKSTTDIVQVLMEREAAYQVLINQANDRLENADKDRQTLNSNTSTGITSEQAAGIALQIYPNTLLLNAPRLVSFQGTAAYEITLMAGTVYISSETGLVLYSTIPTSLSSSPTYYGSGGGNGSQPASFHEAGEHRQNDDKGNSEDGQKEEHEAEHEGEGEHN